MIELVVADVGGQVVAHGGEEMIAHDWLRAAETGKCYGVGLVACFVEVCGRLVPNFTGAALNGGSIQVRLLEQPDAGNARGAGLYAIGGVLPGDTAQRIHRFRLAAGLR